MGSTGANPQSTPSPTIPIIDFSPWYTDPAPTARLPLARALVSACRRVGFVYITNHGLSQNLLDKAFATSKNLFSLTHEQKMLAPHPDGPEIHRGYSYPGLEKVSQDISGDEAIGASLRSIRDCKESYEIGSEANTQQPNIWLPSPILPGFRECTTEFYWECHNLAQELLRAMAMGLGLEDTEFFVRYHSGHNNQLRLLHYPPLPAREVEEQRAARMPAHSDWGSITLLFQDDCGGLEVEDPGEEEGRFVAATPVEGACVVNVGDLLMRWSNDYLKSTLHRVTLPPLSDRFEGAQRLTRARYSIPYFVSADPEALVECLPCCADAEHPVKYEPVLQDSYRRMRAKLQYPKSKPVAAAS